MAATPRILIVDDEPQILTFLSLTFDHAGYSVRTASNGSDAIALCSDEPFDIVLTDVRMPEMNGHQLAEWIAVHHPTTRTALMSGYDNITGTCSCSPRCRLIPKPFAPTEIISFVGQILEKL
jgi:DNA-binding NtrC family response regulator